MIALMQGLLIGISAGANVVVDRYIGQGDEEHVEKAVGTSILISLVGGLLLLLIGVSFSDTFLKLTNCPEELFSEAVLYFRMYFAGVPILMVYNFCAAILRSAGDARRPMLFLTWRLPVLHLLPSFHGLFLQCFPCGLCLKTMVLSRSK